MKIPIISKETLKTLGEPVKTDWGSIKKRGVFDILCEKHNVYYDSRVACLMCFNEKETK